LGVGVGVEVEWWADEPVTDGVGWVSGRGRMPCLARRDVTVSGHTLQFAQGSKVLEPAGLVLELPKHLRGSLEVPEKDSRNRT
jgi:hypothetical protein